MKEGNYLLRHLLHLRQHTLCFSPPMQVMVTNVTSLLKTVKAVEDEATRGTRALEATIEYIKQELTVSTQQMSLQLAVTVQHTTDT